MDETLKAEIEDIRRSGICNLFDLPYVQRLAFDRNYFDLVLFIEDHRDEYVRYILYGDDGSRV